MNRQDAENIINAKIKDNVTRDISPKDVRDALNALLDYTDSEGAGGGSIETVTASANKEYTIPDDKLLEKIIVIPSGSLNGFGVGTANGSFDISPAMPVSGAELFSLNIYADGDKNIWFNGITLQTTIKIYLR